MLSIEKKIIKENKNKIVPLQLKINNFSLDELHMFTSGITLLPIYNDDNEFLENVMKYVIRLMN